MHAYLHCLSHTPLVGFVDPEQAVLDEVNGVIADARRRIAEFDPELVVLFAPDHYNGFFYDVMPPFCLGVGATAIGDFASAAGDLLVPTELAEACAHAVINSGIDLAVSYNMQVDHGFAQPLEFLLGGLDRVPVLPVFINGVAAVIDMDTQRAAPLVDIEESAGGGFSLRLIAHVSLPVNQISVVALSEPNPAIHSGIGR